MDSENEDQSGVILSGFARTLIGVLFSMISAPSLFQKMSQAVFSSQKRLSFDTVAHFVII